MLKILSLTFNEIYRIFHQKITYLYILSVMGIIVLCTFEVSQITRGANQHGFLYLTLAMQTTFNFIGVMVLLIFSSTIICSEVEKKTIRNILTRPVSRMNFFLAKLLATLIFQQILILAAATTGIIVGMASFGFADLVENGALIYTKEQIGLNFLLGCLVISFPLFAVTCYGLLISSLVDSIVAAVSVSIASFIVLDIAKVRFGFAPYIFSSYIATPFTVVADMIEGFHFSWTPKVYYCIGISMVWIVSAIFVGTQRIRNRDF